METLATKYFIKATDAYPFNLEETIEALDYALSYDETHAGAHCLMGNVCLYYTLDYGAALYHFEQAMANDLNYTDTYYGYISLLLITGEYAKAHRLLTYAKKVKGIRQHRLLMLETELYEREGKLTKAKRTLHVAFLQCLSTVDMEDVERAQERIKKKFKAKRSKAKKRKKANK
ncbi:MAG: hypothetical protein CL843_10720 [Crocinitomicaceae bacterium]|nr:hypothetical protein [Crocinitomicaceae bacterium]